MSANLISNRREPKMSKTRSAKFVSPEMPLTEQQARQTQAFGNVVSMPIALAENTRRTSTANLNHLLADTITLRDMYKKHHWPVSSPTSYHLHLLFDTHTGEQTELVDEIAERVMMLGGVSVARSGDVAAMTWIPQPPTGREEVPAQISRLVQAHEIVLKEAHTMAQQAAEEGDDDTSNLLSSVIRTNKMQVWLVAGYLVDGPLVHADGEGSR
jgi:starvation-inducible DNA-binding protein